MNTNTTKDDKDYYFKLFWIIFLKDPATGAIHGTAHGHNATADYKNNPYYIGTKLIDVDLNELKP